MSEAGASGRRADGKARRFIRFRRSRKHFVTPTRTTSLRLLVAFPEYWERYREYAQIDLRRQNAAETQSIEAALLIAGQLTGLATRLDADVLERFLASDPKGFPYEETCRAAIAFRRAIDKAIGGAR